MITFTQNATFGQLYAECHESGDNWWILGVVRLVHTITPIHEAKFLKTAIVDSKDSS